LIALKGIYRMSTLTTTNTNIIRRGFTLIEILIVVVILGILAAIVVPQFTNAADSAKSSSLKSQLQTLRGQCELFYAQTGAYPDLITNGWDELKDGDYILSDPRNPFTDASTATSVSGAVGVGVAWVWVPKGGGSSSWLLTAVNTDGTAFNEITD
jgi:general secretion pathway protein G